MLSKVFGKFTRLVRLLVILLVIGLVQLRGGNYPLSGTFRPGMTALGPKHASMALWYVGGPGNYQKYLGDVPAAVPDANDGTITTRISLDQLAAAMMKVRSAAGLFPFRPS